MYKYILLIIAIVLCLWAINKAVEGAEELECKQWIAESEVIEDYYFTSWQKRQCKL